MKITYHLPTEQFGFVELEDNHDTLEAIPSYEDIKASVVPKIEVGEGLDRAEWNKVLDGYLTVGTMPSDAYQRMSQKQVDMVQEIKKSMARLNPRETRPPRINNEI